MRILVVVSYYKPAYIYGGPVSSVSNLCEALVQSGHTVNALTTNANGAVALDVPVDRAVDVDGVQVHYFDRKPWAPSRYFYAPELYKACQRLLPSMDILYACATWTYPMIPAARLAVIFRKPYVISPRGDLMEWSLRQKTLKKKIYMALVEKHLIECAAAVHCTSEDESNQYSKLNLPAPAFIVPNGLDLTPFQSLPARGALRKRLGVSYSALLSLFVGRLHKVKGLERTITEFASVSQICSDAHLVIAGVDEDGSGARAEAQVSELGLQERVHFLGAVYGNDLLQAYVDSDMFVLLSHRENFGMVVVEAMASGLPVLVSREVALAEYVEKYRAGLVVNLDVESAAPSWILLLNDPAKREELRRNGIKLAQERFSSIKVAEQLARKFEEIIQRHE